jgi:hypothetical protein
MLLDPLVSNIKDYRTNLQFFSLLLVCGDLAQSWCTSPMKILEVRQRSFQKLTQFTMLNKVQGPLACNINPSLTRATVLLLFIEWGDSAQRWCCSSRKAMTSRHNSLKEQTEFTILTMLLDPLVLTWRFLLQKLQFFSHLLVCGDFAQSLCSSPMEMLKVRQCSS